MSDHWCGITLAMLACLYDSVISLMLYLFTSGIFIPPPNEVGGGVYWIYAVNWYPGEMDVIQWTWYFFHITSGRINTCKGVNQLKELFFLDLIIIFIRPSLDGTYYGMAPSVRPSVRPTVSTKKHRCKWRIFFKFCTQVCLGVPSINLLFVLSYLIKYAHNSIISDFSIFGIHRVIF